MDEVEEEGGYNWNTYSIFITGPARTHAVVFLILLLPKF